MQSILRRITIVFFICAVCLLANAQEKTDETRDLFPIEQNDRWGYINRLGNIVIPPQYEEADGFSEGLAPVKLNGKWGFINEAGKLLIAPQFSGAYPFSEGLARVQVGGDKYRMYGKWGFIDKTGRLVIEPQYGDLSGVAETSQGFHEGLAMIEVDYQKGFIDKTGMVIIPTQFGYAYHFTEGLACVSKGLDQKWGYIDHTGRWAIPPQFDHASLFSEGLAPAARNGNRGYIDQTGAFKLKPRLKPNDDWAVVYGHFNDGLSRWRIGNLYGFIDKSGKVVIEPMFDLTDSFSEGMAYVVQDGKYGYINTSGNLVIQPQFYYAKSFHHGLAWVKYGANDSWGYIDKTGTFVWKTSPVTSVESETFSFIQAGHTRDMLFVGWSPDGKLLVSYSAADGWIKVWNPQNGQLLWNINATTLSTDQPIKSPDGSLLATGARGVAYEIRDAGTGNVIWDIKAHSTSPARVRNPDSNFIAERGRYGDAVVSIYDVKSNALVRRLEGHPGIVHSVAFSPDSRIIASGSGDRTIRLWEVQTGRLLKTIFGHMRTVKAVAFSDDGTRLVSGSEDDTIKIWEVSSGRLMQNITGFSSGVGGINAVAFGPHGRMLVASSGTQVKLFATASGKLLRTFATHESHTTPGPEGMQVTMCCGSEANSVAYSPNGTRVISGHEDGTIKLWEIKSGRLLRIMKGRSAEVYSVLFSPDGRIIASGKNDEEQGIELWSVQTGKLIRRFGEDSDYVRSLAFSPDGELIVSGHLTNDVKLWEVKTGKLIREFEGKFSENDQVAFSPDGKLIVSGGENQDILLWDVKTGKLLWHILPLP